MDRHLLKQALSKFILGFVCVGALLFAPAASFHYWQGWQLMGIPFIPMFMVGMATTILFLSMPLILGSVLSLLIMAGYIPVIVKRIRNEETVLEKGLEGYADYKKRVRYRIIPLIW